MPDRRKLGQAANAIGQARGIRINERLRHATIAQRGGKKDIGCRSALQQEPRHVRSITNQPLRGRGFVILVASVHAGAVCKKQLGRFDVREK
jgi:hypothetical protein